VGIVCACLPHLKPLLMRIFPQLRWEVEPDPSSAAPVCQVNPVENSWGDTYPGRLSESYGDTSSNVPPRQVERTAFERVVF
jgi:hypothetical protein